MLKIVTLVILVNTICNATMLCNSVKTTEKLVNVDNARIGLATLMIDDSNDINKKNKP